MTCLWYFQAWMLYPGSGTIMASPATCQGDVMGWCHRCAVGRESSTSSLCWVISAHTWAHVWPWHTVWAPKAACRESLSPFSLQRGTCVQTRLDSANSQCLAAGNRWRCCGAGYLLPASWVNWNSTMWLPSSTAIMSPRDVALMFASCGPLTHPSAKLTCSCFGQVLSWSHWQSPGAAWIIFTGI